MHPLYNLLLYNLLFRVIYNPLKNKVLTGNRSGVTIVTMASKKRLVQDSQAYWERVLRENGLDMDAGRDPSHRKLIYIGGATEIESLDAHISTDMGRVKPTGNGPDND